MPGRVISLLGGAERGRGPRGDGVGASGGWFLYASAGGGVCRGNDRVFFVSGFQDLRGNARGGRVLSASGWAHQGTTWREKTCSTQLSDAI